MSKNANKWLVSVATSWMRRRTLLEGTAVDDVMDVAVIVGDAVIDGVDAFTTINNPVL